VFSESGGSESLLGRFVTSLSFELHLSAGCLGGLRGS
jgi:hypothetical protein